MRRMLPFFESLLLHGLLLGSLAFVVGTVAPPTEPALVKLDFRLINIPADEGPAPPPTAAPGPVKTQPLSRPKQPVPPRSQPIPPPPASKPVPTQETVPVAAPIPSPEPAQSFSQPTSELPAEPLPTQAADSFVTDTVVATTPAGVAGLPASDVSANPGSGEAGLDAAELAADSYRTTNFGAIRDAILGRLRYPLLARRQGWSGLAEVSFRINTDGELFDLRIATSSGYPLLDEQALAAVRKAAPFPSPPVVAQLIIPVSFVLN